MKSDVQTREDSIPDFVKSLLNDTCRRGVTVVFHCSLFGDMVTENLCLLRRRQLSGTGVFFCEDCNVIMSKPWIDQP